MKDYHDQTHWKTDESDFVSSRQKSFVYVEAVLDYGFELVNHPPYSTDITMICSTIKKEILSGSQYRSHGGVMSARGDIFYKQDERSDVSFPETKKCSY